MVDRTLFDVTVKETQQNREYWARRDWISDVANGIRTAKILIVPWEGFRDVQGVLFPQGTSDFVKRLRAAGTEVELVATPAVYQEIALHANAWRLPTILVSSILLPSIASLLAAEVHDIIGKAGPSDTIEMKVIVEGDHGKCISIEYKGVPSRALDTLAQEAAHCFPQTASKTTEPPSLQQGDGHSAGDERNAQ